MLPSHDIYSVPSLITALGIRMQQDVNGIITGTMPVDGRTIQPYGFLSGGASLALAETLAGYGSVLLCKEGEYPSGMHVSASHMAAVPVVFEGADEQYVQATATLLHKGRTTHVWNIDIVDARGRLISTVRVTNMILQHTEATMSAILLEKIE